MSAHEAGPARRAIWIALIAMLAVSVAACGEEKPAVGDDGDDASAVAAAADLSGVQVEMRHEPG